MTFDDMVRIEKEIVLGIIPTKEDDPEEAEFRKQIESDYAQAKAAGFGLDYPKDWN